MLVLMNTNMYVFIHAPFSCMYTQVHVCMFVRKHAFTKYTYKNTHTHIHTYIIYSYIYTNIYTHVLKYINVEISIITLFKIIEI